jgi:isochorismate synthase
MALLFAGAGIVADSEPRAELDETAAKFRSMLGALGPA